MNKSYWEKLIIKINVIATVENPEDGDSFEDFKVVADEGDDVVAVVDVVAELKITAEFVALLHFSSTHWHLVQLLATSHFCTNSDP